MADRGAGSRNWQNYVVLFLLSWKLVDKWVSLLHRPSLVGPCKVHHSKVSPQHASVPLSPADSVETVNEVEPPTVPLLAATGSTWRKPSAEELLSAVEPILSEALVGQVGASYQVNITLPSGARSTYFIDLSSGQHSSGLLCRRREGVSCLCPLCMLRTPLSLVVEGPKPSPFGSSMKSTPGSISCALQFGDCGLESMLPGSQKYNLFWIKPMNFPSEREC